MDLCRDDAARPSTSARAVSSRSAARSMACRSRPRSWRWATARTSCRSRLICARRWARTLAIRSRFGLSSGSSAKGAQRPVERCVEVEFDNITLTVTVPSRGLMCQLNNVAAHRALSRALACSHAMARDAPERSSCLRTSNLVGPGLAHGCFVFVAQAVQQSKCNGRPLVRRQGQCFVDQVVHTSVHAAQSSNLPPRMQTP